MHARHRAEGHEVGLARKLDDLRQAAFERGGRVRDAGAVDGLALGLHGTGPGELIHSGGEGLGGGVHHITGRVIHQVDAEDAAFPELGHAVLRSLPVLLGRGRGEHDLRRGVGHCVEEAVGREVVAQPRAGADPADRPGRDDGAERVVRQAVAILGAIEHLRSPVGVPPELVPAPARGHPGPRWSPVRGAGSGRPNEGGAHGVAPRDGG